VEEIVIRTNPFVVGELRRVLSMFVFVVALLSVPAGAETKDDRVTLSGRVSGASGGHTVHVALWDADGFLREPKEDLRIAAGADTSFRFRVRPGRWTVSAYEDKNENGELDMGMFGPKEPSGFWHPFKAWRKPRFDDVAVLVERDTADANVLLK
jgi:uncharacterized protein (DUF2141 family)